MYMLRTINGSTLDEALHPPFRVVNYGDDPAVLTVSTRLRQSWVTAPSFAVATASLPSGNEDEEPPSGPIDIGTIFRNIQSASPEKLQRMRNQDRDDIHTPLRDAVYYNWNHVFWDVSTFLADACCGTGHLHPPAEDVFAVEYPGKGRVGKGTEDRRSGGSSRVAVVAEKVFDTSVLLAPAFLEEGVKVILNIGEGEDANIVVDATEANIVYNKTEVYWVRKGEKVTISVDLEFAEDGVGVAAVFVYGRLCDCGHEGKNDEEEDESMESGEERDSEAGF